MLLALILLYGFCLELPVDAQSLQSQGAADKGAADKGSTDVVSPRTGIVGGDEKAIHEILSQHCFDCHGLDEAAATLRLDSLESNGLVSDATQTSSLADPPVASHLDSPD